MIYVGIITALIVFPASIGIVAVFRLAGDRPRKRTAKERWKTLALATNASKRLLNALPNKKSSATVLPMHSSKIGSETDQPAAAKLVAAAFLSKASKAPQKQSFAALVKKAAESSTKSEKQGATSEYGPKLDVGVSNTATKSSVSFISTAESHKSSSPSTKVLIHTLSLHCMYL